MMTLRRKIATIACAFFLTAAWAKATLSSEDLIGGFFDSIKRKVSIGPDTDPLRYRKLATYHSPSSLSEISFDLREYPGLDLICIGSDTSMYGGLSCWPKESAPAKLLEIERTTRSRENETRLRHVVLHVWSSGDDGTALIQFPDAGIVCIYNRGYRRSGTQCWEESSVPKKVSELIKAKSAKQGER